MSRLTVGLVGPIGVGKTTIAEHFLHKGFKKLKFSDPIKEETDRRQLPHTRKVYQDVGDSLREKFGNDYISRSLIDKSKENGDTTFVVEGFRNPGEIRFFQKLPSFILIGLNADPKVRFERLKKRGESHDPKTWTEFRVQEDRDQGVGQPEYGQHILESLELADFVIDTDKVKSEVFKQVEKVLKEYQDEPDRTNTRRSAGCDFC